MAGKPENLLSAYAHHGKVALRLASKVYETMQSRHRANDASRAVEVPAMAQRIHVQAHDHLWLRAVAPWERDVLISRSVVLQLHSQRVHPLGDLRMREVFAIAV